MEDTASSKPLVFLSFRGEDTRKNFTDHLYNALKDKGFDTFRDDDTLARGADLSTGFFKAIEESKVAIVVFSKNYATSTWCLKELAKIADCRRKGWLKVYPIFYHVDPGDMRKVGEESREEWSFVGEQLNIHRTQHPEETVKSWEEAVKELANTAGEHVQDRQESEVIGKINKVVSKALESLLSSTVIKDHVGMESRVKNFEVYLNSVGEDVSVVGIWGTDGIGKKTLAKEVFEKIRHSFDVSGMVYITDKYRGNRSEYQMILLQKQFFKDVLQCAEKIDTIDLGASKIKGRLCFKNVLIILVDVDSQEQVEVLVGKPGEQHAWFGPKSRIIVPTTNRELLKRYGDNYNNIYEVEELTEDEGLQFFYRKAFRNKHPPNDVFEKLSLKFVRYAGGLPCALVSLSRFLYDKSEKQWEQKLDHLAQNPDEEISNKLRSSYDALSTTNQQMFLQIAFFLHGKDERCVTKTLEGCSFNTDIGIPALVDRSLITIEGRKVMVHDLLIQMARHIRREEKKAGKRSRSYVDLGDAHHLPTETKFPDDISCLSSLQQPDSQKSSCFEDCTSQTPLAMIKVPPDNISGENNKGLINDGKLFQIHFPSADRSIPEWFLCKSESPFEIDLSLKDPDHDQDRKRNRKGFALFLVFEIKKRYKFDELWEFGISLHFCIDNERLENSLHFKDFKDSVVGSYAVCFYVPLEWFAGQLNALSHMLHTSVSAKPMDIIELRIFGIDEVVEQGVEDFSNKLAQLANDNLELNFNEHCKKLFVGESQIHEASGNVAKNYLTAQRNKTVINTPNRWGILRSIMRLYLSQKNRKYDLFQENLRRQNNTFSYPCFFPMLSSWFFHHGVENVAVCYLPSNLYNDERWLGLELYVQCKQVDDSASKAAYLDLHLYAHGKVPWFWLSTHRFKINNAGFVAFHVPNTNFQETLNNCKGLSAFFQPTTSDVEVKMCGTKLLYKQDLESIGEGVMECICQRDYKHFRYVSGDPGKWLNECDIEVQQEMPRPSHMPRNRKKDVLNSWRNILTSTEQVEEEVATSLHNYRKEYVEGRAFDHFEPVLLHSVRSFLENYDRSKENTWISLSTNFNHLHITAETLINDQIETFKYIFGEFFKHRILVTLSLEGHIVFVLRHFHPSSPYKLCFPNRAIPKWFGCQESKSKVAIELPPDLCSDKSWRGLVICAAFSVKEPPGTFSKASFKLLCHLSSAGQCLNSAALCSISSKDQIKWLLHQRKFIWLTYIPCGMLTELNGKHSVEARIYNPCPELIVDKCGIRLLYETDVDELREIIVQCCTLVVEDSYDLYQRPGSRSPRRSRTEAEDENWLMRGRYMIDLFYLNVIFFVKKVVTG